MDANNNYEIFFRGFFMNKYVFLAFSMSCGMVFAEDINIDVTKVPPMVVWSGSSVSDVGDVNLLIKSDVTLPIAQTYIFAENNDVTVNFEKDLKIKGNNDGQSILILGANQDRTLVFNVNHDIKFIGTKDNPDQPLLIGIIGGGTVIFKISNGDSLKFDSKENYGGAEMYCVFQQEQMPTCVFELHGGIQLKFNTRCRLGHICVAPVIVNDFLYGGFRFDLSHAPGHLIQLECKEGFASPLNTIPPMP